MSAVAINPKDMDILQGLQKRLKMRSKSQVIHRALEELAGLVERAYLAQQIAQSVKKCNKADQKENVEIMRAAAFHLDDES